MQDQVNLREPEAQTVPLGGNNNDTPIEVILVSSEEELSDALLEIINDQIELVDVLKMFEGENYDPEFTRRVNVLTMKRLLDRGRSLDSAVAAALKSISPSETRIVIPKESAPAVLSDVVTPFEEPEVLKDTGETAPAQGSDQAVLVMNNGNSEDVEDHQSVESDFAAIKVAQNDEEEISDDQSPILQVSTQEDGVRPVVGGFFGDLLKKGARAVVRGVSSAIPGGSMVYDAVEGMIKGEPRDDRSDLRHEGVTEVSPSLDTSVVSDAAPSPRLEDDKRIYGEFIPSYYRGSPQREQPKICPTSQRIRPWEGGPGPVSNSEMPVELAREIVSRRLAKHTLGAIDVTTRLPFIIPLSEAIEIVSSPIRKDADFSLMHMILTNSIIRQSTREFRTQVKSETFDDTAITLTADEDLPGDEASYKVPFFIVSFGLSELEGVTGAVVQFNMTIPQGTAIDGPLESKYALGSGFRLLSTGDILLRLSPERDSAKTGRLLIFPWTSDQAVIGYQPAFVRSNHDPDDDSTNNVDKVQLNVKAAPKGTFVTLEIPGLKDPLLEELTNALYTGMM